MRTKHSSLPVYFVHMSDTHFGPTRDYSRHGITSYPYAQKIVEIINSLPVQPDFVMHTGDVTTDPHPDAYRLAAGVLAGLKVPIYYAVGNHDTARDIHRFLPMGPKHDLTNNQDILSYTFEVKGYRFLVIDARGPDEIDPRGFLSEEKLSLIEEVIKTHDRRVPLTVFIHYPCLPFDSTWMDAYMLVINGELLHGLFCELGDCLRGVFFGHVHQPMQVIRDGVLYASVSSTFAQFAAWPGTLRSETDLSQPPGYSFVHLLPETTVIHQRTFPWL